jgi:glycosyltransferase involved in cell wall biosynthesis
MRILIATHYHGILGGTETYLRALIPGLQSLGHTLGVVYQIPSAENQPTLTDNLQIAQWSASDLRLETLISEVTTWKPDIVFCHGLTDPKLEESLITSFPAIFYAHVYTGTCISSNKCHSRPRYQICHRRFGLACLGLYLPRGCGGWNPLTMVRLYRFERKRSRLLKQYRAICVASNHMANELLRNGIPANQVYLAPLFAPNCLPDPDPPSRREQTNRILFLGRLTPLKGLSHLLEAIPLASHRLNRPLKLIVAGDGPERTGLEREARQKQVDAEFLGWIGPQQRQVLLREVDILAVPSVWPEPFGIAGIEAGCVGLPTVGYLVGGISDWLRSGISGEGAIGDTPNPNSLAEAIIRALRDQNHWQQLRRGAWVMAQQFTLQNHLQRIDQVLHQTVNI